MLQLISKYILLEKIQTLGICRNLFLTINVSGASETMANFC